jgi:hypothetical protein
VRHRGLEPIPERELTEAIARAPSDHYVIWTGEPCNGQAGSLRSRALACLTEVGQAFPLRTLMRRAASLDGGGLNPDAVRSAVRMHQMARPAVYLLVKRLGSGEFVAVADIPFATAGERRVIAGQPLMDRQGRLLLPVDAPSSVVMLTGPRSPDGRSFESASQPRPSSATGSSGASASMAVHACFVAPG